MEFLQANPAWITSAMFLLTFGESIVILGLFIPASLVMPGIGALAAAVGIGPVEIMFYASLGMIIGDTVSYAIGLMIGTRIETWVPNQYQKQLHQAIIYMFQHQTQSSSCNEIYYNRIESVEPSLLPFWYAIQIRLY